METLDLTLESLEVKISGKTLTFYPLNFKALRILSNELETLRTAGGAEKLDAICQVLLYSANREGSQVTLETLQEMLDPAIATRILEHVNKMSGFRRVVEGESKESNPTKPRNGALSTDQSLQLPDGRGEMSMI